ncbi:MAG: phosphoadenosine phosphosulfate reductase family protein [Bacteroidota bacterium]
MNKITSQNIALFNANLRYENPQDIISFVLQLAKRPIVTTSFGAYSAGILHACTQVKKDIQVIWCDTGYNTPATYGHVQRLSDLLQLNLDVFTPKYTTAFIDHMLGRPDVTNPKHQQFSEEVKLEPFQRAFAKHQPDVWFTNLRHGQTAHRDHLDILSFSSTGLLKVSPFFYFSDSQMLAYLEENELPVEFDYFDPVKALEHRECGIHLKN